MTDLRLPILQASPRKPVATSNHGFPYQPYDGPPSQRIAPNPAPPSHSRTRTSSSHVLAYPGNTQHFASPAPQYPAGNYVPSRRLSSATTSTSSTGNNYAPQTASSANSDIRRSSSSRSTMTQPRYGYVALMRRQKATVWCDRAQSEDARLRAQKMADKKRALLEVHGVGAGRTGTLGSGKLKHSSKGGVTDFSPSTLVAATVPVRLSANEIGDGDDDALSESGMLHRRTNSGRSSLGSGHRYPSGYQRSIGSTNTPPGEKSDLPGVSEDPSTRPAETKKPEDSTAEDATAANHQEDSFGSVGELAAPSAAAASAAKAKTADELRRRGSVDDRTMTMSGVRLFIANPDLSE